MRAVEWDARRDGSLLLRGRDLEEAERVLAANAGKDPRPTELQQRYVHASRRVGVAAPARRCSAGVTSALAVSIVLGVVALLQRNDARSATRKATSTALAALATNRLASRPDQALLLALDAYASSPSADARNAAVTALETARELSVSEFVYGYSAVRDAAFDSHGRKLVVGSSDGSVRVWDVRARKQVATLAESGSPIVSVGFARDGSLVAAGSADGAVRLWKARSGDPAAPDLHAKKRIVASAVSRDARRAAAIDAAGNVWLWDVGSDTPHRLRIAFSNEAHDLEFSPDGWTLAGATSYDSGNSVEGSVRIWDTTTRKGRDLPNDEDIVEALAFSPDSGTLATGGHDDGLENTHGQLRLWNVRTLERIASLEKEPPIFAVAFGKDGPTVVAGSDDGSIRIARSAGDAWTLADTGLRVPGRVTSLVVAPDGRRVAVAPDGAATVRVMSVEKQFGRVVGKPRGDVTDVSFDSAGSVVATVKAGDAAPERWNLTTDRRVRAGSTPTEGHLAVSVKRSGVKDVRTTAAGADGRTVAIGDGDGKVWIWDSRRAGEARPLGGDAAWFETGLAMSADGRTLAVGQGGTLDDDSIEIGVQLWDVRDQRPLGSLLRTVGEVDSLAFSPDGRVLATGVYATSAEGGAVQLWEGILWRDLADLRAQVCGLVLGDVTEGEWASIAPGVAYRRACS